MPLARPLKRTVCANFFIFIVLLGSYDYKLLFYIGFLKKEQCDIKVLIFNDLCSVDSFFQRGMAVPKGQEGLQSVDWC